LPFVAATGEFRPGKGFGIGCWRIRWGANLPVAPIPLSTFSNTVALAILRVTVRADGLRMGPGNEVDCVTGLIA
jgi:hypothetical protein